MKHGGRRGRLALTGAIVVLLGVALVAADRRPLRAAEEAYVDGRRVTACATRELRPFADPERGLDDLPQALEQVIRAARAEAVAVRQESTSLRRGLLPPTRRAVRSVQEALDEQVALYEAMVDDPQGSEDDLVTLGRANTAAERRLRAARGWLFAGEPDGWDRRFTCRPGGTG